MKPLGQSEKNHSIHFGVPAGYLDRLFGWIDDLSELQVILRILFLLRTERGFPPFVMRKRVEEDQVLASVFESRVKDTRREISSVLDKAVAKGHLLDVILITSNGQEQELVLLNVEENNNFIRRSEQREIQVRGFGQVRLIGQRLPKYQDVFSLYEENIGVITPIVADELKDAETSYSYEVIADAIKEAAVRNKRSWRYVSAILRSWSQEGRQCGSDWRRAEKVSVAKVFKEPKGPLLSR
ncbi:MAG: DnaD domain protein [SAR202 cluster bacterium]|nr:DnaD domain protein [SAR202 cluster bacterium]